MLSLLVAGAILRGVYALNDPLQMREINWLAKDASPLARAYDAWVGAASDDRWMRLLPVLLGASAVPVAGGLLLAEVGAVEALATAGTIAALPLLALGSRQIGPIALLVLLAVASLAATSLGGIRAWAILACLALMSLLVDPAMAVVPLGAAFGLELARRRSRITACVVTGAILVLLVWFLLAGPKMGWGGTLWGSSGHRLQQAVLLLAVVAMTARRIKDRGERITPLAAAAMGVALLCLIWLLLPPLREVSRAPFVALATVLPVVALAGDIPLPAAEWTSRVMAACALASWVLADAWTGGRPPLSQAGADLAVASPAVSEVLPGWGLSPGTVAHAVSRFGLPVVAEPTQPVVGRMSLLALRPSPGDRLKLAAVLGERVLQSYGGRDSKEGGVRWSVYRPVTIAVNPDGPRPNIAIVSVDTLRSDHMSVYGYPRETSPRLRQWAAGAWVYDRAISAYPATSPSFATLLTGRLPSGHGLRYNYHILDAGNWTLARILKKAGYDCAAFVSSYVLSDRNSGLEIGFDLYDDRFDTTEAQREYRPVRLAPSLARAVEAWLDDRSENPRPWFLWIHAIDPHGPYTPLPEFQNAFHDPRVRLIERQQIPDYQWLNTLNFFSYVDAYDAEILQTDWFLGDLIRRLEAFPSRQGTIVIFVADHGEEFGERRKFFLHGGTLHAELLNVPLLIKDPSMPGAGRKRELVSLADISPTLLSRLRISTDLPLDGVPLAERAGGRRAVLSQQGSGQVSAQRLPWKVILRHPGTAPAEAVFFNVETDPAETRPQPAAEDERAALLSEAGAFHAADPLARADVAAGEREQWRSLPAADREKLKALGYVGP